MSYTIATFDQVQGNLIIDISTCGNQWVVSIWDKEEHASTTARFDTLEDAYKVYEKMVAWSVFSYYSDEDKKTFLRTGTMK